MGESDWYKPSRAPFQNKAQSESHGERGGGGGAAGGFVSFEINVSGQTFFDLSNTTPSG